MVKLESPKIELVPSYLDFIEEMRSFGEKIWEEIIPFKEETNAGFIERLALYQ